MWRTKKKTKRFWESSHRKKFGGKCTIDSPKYELFETPIKELFRTH